MAVTLANPIAITGTTTVAYTWATAVKVTALSLVNANTTVGEATVYDGASGTVLFVISNAVTNSVVFQPYPTPVRISPKVNGITYSVTTGSTLYVYTD
jgi:hypothetical protein